MRRFLVMLALLLPVLTVIAAGEEDEVTAKLRFLVGETTRYPLVSIAPTQEPPAGLVVPEDMEDSWFVKRNFGVGRELLVAAHFDPQPAWIRIDRNFDGSLDGEEPFYLKAIGSGNALEALIDVEIPLDPRGAPEKVTLRFIHHASATSHCLHLAVPVHMEGEVVLAGRVRKVVLADGDHDLLFETPDQDLLFLDTDGDTEVVTTNSGPEAIVSGKPFRVGDRGFVADLKKNGDIVFRPSAKVPGPEETAWPRTGAVTAGKEITGPVAPFAELAKEYAKAEEQDKRAGANVTTDRSKIIGDIGKTGEREAFSFLIDLAKGDPNVNIRSNALRATGYLCYQPYAAAVFELASDSGTPAVAMAAFDALHGMDAPNREPLLLEVLKKTNDESIFGAAGRNLAYLGSGEGLRLLGKLATEHPQETFRYQAYQTATRYGTSPPPAAMVIAAAISPHPPLRTLGLEHAMILGLPESIDLGAAALKDSGDARVRLAAVRLLATRDDPEAVSVLFQAVGSMPDDARGEMVKLLAPVRNPASVALCCDRLASGSPPEREVAAEVLAAIRTDETTKALLARLGKEKDPRVLTAVIRAIGVHRPPGADVKIVAAAEGTKSDPLAFAAALDALASFGLENPKVLRFFEKALKSREFEVRVVAVEAAGKAGGEIAADLLLGAIDDKAWQVRLTAVQGLGKVRVRRAVRPLIDRMSEEEVPRVVAAIADTLFRTTGRNFYDIVELWERWWKEHGEDFEVPVEVPEIKPDDHGGRSVASFYGVPVETDRLIFVIDQSGSMSSASGNRTKLEVAVEQTLAVVKTLGKNARFNVILFETAIHPWQKQLVKVNASTRGALENHLKGKHPMGGTNLYDGLEMALLTRDVDTVYLLSDGSPGSGRFVKHEDILREVRKINRTKKIAIHCIAVGFDSPLMKDLAAENGGQYVRR